MVERYDLYDDYEGRTFYMTPKENGEYVKYGDYKKLEEENEKLKATIEALNRIDTARENLRNGKKKDFDEFIKEMEEKYTDKE